MALVCLAIHKAGWPEETPKTRAFQQETAVPLFECLTWESTVQDSTATLAPIPAPASQSPEIPQQCSIQLGSSWLALAQEMSLRKPFSPLGLSISSVI